MRVTIIGAFALVFTCFIACGPAGPTVNDNNQYNQNSNAPCTEGDHRCWIGSYQQCSSGTWFDVQQCVAPTPACDPVYGCVQCQPGANFCVGDTVTACNVDGTPGSAIETCTGDQACVAGVCTSPCLVAEQTNSYIGCDYWPTPTSNSQLDTAFANNFGVVVHNANSQAATVSITLGTSQVAEETIQAGELHTFQLQLDLGLKNEFQTEESGKVANAAYHLTSTLPVTVYQFNPLDYETGGTYSHSNDASLVLPTHVLSTNYLVMSRQTFGVDTSGMGFGFSFSPGMVAIVGTENGTTVTVTSTAYTLAGTGVNAFTPGSQQQFTVNAGEVVQILTDIPALDCSGSTSSDDCNGQGGNCTYCDMGAQYDLTGTRIESTLPVAVFAGHNCSFVPFNYWACDHLEEQMMPLETWGDDYIVARTEPQNESSNPAIEPNVIRILSGSNGNNIQFNPSQPTVGSSVTLGEGEWVEFEATGDFHVWGDAAFMVAQFTVGQNYYTTSLDYHGDPAYALMVPTEQFRAQYTFLAPSTITYNFLNVIKKVGEGSHAVYLDDVAIPESDFTARIGDTEFGVARVAISGTHHTVHSNDAFGITVYGFAQYTSYMYPGGLDLKYINPVD